MNEPVKGLLQKLPGCITITSGPEPATPAQMTCDSSFPPPTLNSFNPSTAADAPTFPAINSTKKGWQYLGSANEPNGVRALAKASMTDPAMTVEKCEQFCTSKQLTLAGVEYGVECYCDTALSSDSSLCATGSTIYNSMVCAGDDKEFCGGPGRLLVFQNIN